MKRFLSGVDGLVFELLGEAEADLLDLRIYSNVVRLADSPNERLLVIFGAGHLGWLRHDFASDPGIRLRKLAEFGK